MGGTAKLGTGDAAFTAGRVTTIDNNHSMSATIQS